MACRKAPANARVERPQAVVEEPPARPAAYAPETLRDLGKISEINQNVFRQPSPRAMLSVAVNEVGNYLRATRCLAVGGIARAAAANGFGVLRLRRRGLLG